MSERKSEREPLVDLPVHRRDVRSEYRRERAKRLGVANARL
jgi:hypothetical protein